MKEQLLVKPSRLLTGGLLKISLLCLFALCAAPDAAAQRAAKLPAPDKIVAEYFKAVGGKKRLAAVRDSVSEWSVERRGQEAGTARVHLKAPDAARTDILLAEGGELDIVANARSAWVREPDGRLRTLTDAESYAARLHALLDASRLVDYKKQNVLARTAALEAVGGDTAYRVEFSTRTGARLAYWFSTTSKLLLKVRDETRRLGWRYMDYRARGAQTLEPHRIEFERDGGETLSLVLREARYNAGVADSIFEPPSESSLDIPALLLEVGRNQDEIDERVSEYTYTVKGVQREINDRGELKKETVTVHEVYPAPGGGEVYKLVSTDGVALTPEQQEKEARRVANELEKLERENAKRKQKRERERAERERRQREHGGGAAQSGADDDLGGIAAFLRACEFVSPRREHFRDREAIVFDFRARPNFKPTNDEESIIAKMVGTVWIDPADKQVIRLEARLDKSYKIGGGLLASIRSGSSFAFEQTRMSDGIWLPRFSQISASAKVLLF
ncbi:MAG TPA: hypothetical protein VGV59_14170, partial [Pyrinomonadaceae bacterium]|nr:hypothetical protein [Pyrinomonadaceae bacterium]